MPINMQKCIIKINNIQIKYAFNFSKIYKKK